MATEDRQDTTTGHTVALTATIGPITVDTHRDAAQTPAVKAVKSPTMGTTEATMTVAVAPTRDPTTKGVTVVAPATIAATNTTTDVVVRDS